MRNSQLFIGAIILGVIALIVGVLYFANILGDHPVRAYTALAAGIVLLLIGIGGMAFTRSRRRL